jgi:hypothetical protein
MNLRRFLRPALPIAIAFFAGCDNDPGPTVPSKVDKPKDAAAVVPAPKTSEGNRPLTAGEPAPGGLPTKAIP